MDGRRGLMMARRPSAQVANVGDIAYKAANGSIKVVNPDKWSASLGTPVGVVVIPSGFAPDNGKARIVSLKSASSSYIYGSDTASSIAWAPNTISDDTSLANHDAVFSTDKNGSIIDVYRNGYLPTDYFLGIVSLSDASAKYYYSDSYSPKSLIPSPYLVIDDIESPNPAYYEVISGHNNALSDFNGKNNTDVLLSLGSKYLAAYAAGIYKVKGAEEIKWYLPGIGELGYMFVRFTSIQAALSKISSKIYVSSSSCFWSSTEESGGYAYYIEYYNGIVNGASKTGKYYVRPFAQLDF